MAGSSSYPVRLEADYPESPSRGLALMGALFIPKTLVLLPHLIVLGLLGMVNMAVVFIGYLAVLLNGRYPEGLFSFVLGVGRWNYRVRAWFAGFTDQYPPFSLASGDDQPVRLTVDYPESSSRFLALLGLMAMAPKAILLLPHLIILSLLDSVSYAVTYVAFWGVLLTGAYPRGLFDFVFGIMKWQTRTDSWLLGLTDRYPPLSLE